MTRLAFLFPVAFSMLAVAVFSPAKAPDPAFVVTLRSRSSPPGQSPVPATEKKEIWDGHKTAIIVCDMWDHHWCKSAEARVGELAGPMNEMLKAARAKGAFIIHA